MAPTASMDGHAKPAAAMQVFGGKQPQPPTRAKSEFIWSSKDEPHAARRREILSKHPEIKQLFGPEPLTKYIVLAVVALQLAVAYALRDRAWTLEFFVAAYVIGATANQNLFLAIHELSHNLGFKSIRANRLLGFFANLPIVIPYASKFKGYHTEHHKMQGVDGIDTDVPTQFELCLFGSVVGKLFFCINQIFFYALRPMFVRDQPLDRWSFLNMGIQGAFVGATVSWLGMGPVWYLLMSSYLAGSLHPCASHFIAEHYVFVGEVETYSYYGPLNVLCYNVGYHNEHHDFPNVPWSRLPKVYQAAPEYYSTLPHHESWPLVIWKFITTPNAGLNDRVKRADEHNIAKTTVCSTRR
eukprot:m.20490 g.20490  ORF g.20490 m.20490 type:complete len:355 (+) comp6178_c1_seq1:152-1216(+)